MSTKKVLLIVSFLRSSNTTISKALRITQDLGAELIIFFVLDVQYADKIAHKLTDEGWLGGKPSEQLYVSLLKEYKLQAEMKIDSMQKHAEKLNIPVRTIIRSGSLLTETLKIAGLEDPDIIVMSRRKRSSLSRFIFGSLAKNLKRQVSCEVRIIDDK